MSAHSVAASYKPPMLVTRVQLPVCALPLTCVRAPQDEKQIEIGRIRSGRVVSLRCNGTTRPEPPTPPPSRPLFFFRGQLTEDARNASAERVRRVWGRRKSVGWVVCDPNGAQQT